MMQFSISTEQKNFILKMIQIWKIFLLIKSHEIEFVMLQVLEKSNFPFWSQTHH